MAVKAEGRKCSAPKIKALLIPVKALTLLMVDYFQFIVSWHKRVTVLVVIIVFVLQGSVYCSLFLHPFTSRFNNMRHAGYVLSLLCR